MVSGKLVIAAAVAILGYQIVTSQSLYRPSQPAGVNQESLDDITDIMAVAIADHLNQYCDPLLGIRINMQALHELYDSAEKKLGEDRADQLYGVGLAKMEMRTEPKDCIQDARGLKIDYPALIEN